MQIREENYGAALEKYSGDILFVGVNYDEQTKKLLEEKLELFYKATHVSFIKDGRYINLFYSLNDQQHSLRYDTKKGVLSING